jgi:hypothetical protein
MFEWREMVTASNESVFAFVCMEHEGLMPVCDLEVSTRKAAQARTGTRPKIVREVHLRITCRMCERTTCRKLEKVAAVLGE